MISVRHQKVSALPDGPDASQVQASDWNEEHPITGTADTLFGFDGSGNALEVTIGSGLNLAAGVLSNTGGGGGGTQEVYVQQTRPSATGPWMWWETDASGVFLDLVVNDGVP